MEKRDKRGLTEAEYLAQYKPGRYPQPSLTVDIILLAHAEGALRVLLVRRGGHPYLGCWALPGGFAEPQETTAQAAARELAEETHAQGLALTPIGLFSTPGRDPRGWTISHAFAALADAGKSSMLRCAPNAAIRPLARTSSARRCARTALPSTTAPSSAPRCCVCAETLF